MKLSDFRGVKWLNLVVCLVFCLNFAFSNSALAFAKDASMLRPEATSAGEGKVLLSMVDKLLQEQDKMTIAEAYRADLGRFLKGGVITPKLIEKAKSAIELFLVQQQLITDYRISYEKGIIYLFITRPSSKAIEDTRGFCLLLPTSALGRLLIRWTPNLLKKAQSAFTNILSLAILLPSA